MKLFVWDFHGVLEKDNDKAVIEITNEVLAQAGHSERLSEERNLELYGLKWFQYFEQLLPHLDEEQHKALQAACFKFAEQNLHILEKHIKLNDHAAEVLDKITAAGHDQIILSNTRPQDLLWFVSTVGLTDRFERDKIIGVNAHQIHETKADAYRQYVQSRPFKDYVIIGDSESDMKLRDISGGTTYFYTHAHLPIKNKPQADRYITDLRQILQEL